MIRCSEMSFPLYPLVIKFDRLMHKIRVQKKPKQLNSHLDPQEMNYSNSNAKYN